MTHVTIIGGGIAGLATAYYLQQTSRARALPLTWSLLEAGDRLGGKITTRTVDGFVMEGGPDSFITQKPAALELCRALNLEDRLIPCHSASPGVTLLQNGSVWRLPQGFRLAVPTEFFPFLKTPILSPLGKLRVCMDLVLPASRHEGDESLASFIRRRLGREVLDRLAGPLMAGIHVADPERLSMHATFPQFVEMERRERSLILAMLRARRRAARSSAPAPPLFMSLRGGMTELIDALAASLRGEVLTRVRANRIRAAGSGYEIPCDTSSGSVARKADLVVLALPASAAADVLAGAHPHLPDRLRAIRHVGTATVSLAFQNNAVTPPPGFGVVIPRSEGRDLLACTWSSNKFEHRAPPGGSLIRLFFGGDGRESLLERSDAELLGVARGEIASLFGVRAKPVHTALFRWPRGNAQYDVGHRDRVAELERLTESMPGLYLTGSSYHGVGIPDCIQQAKKIALRITGRIAGEGGHDAFPVAGLDGF